MDLIEIQYLGEIEGVSLEFDMSSRCKVMRMVDRGRREKQLTRMGSFKKDALFKMDQSGFKVLTLDEDKNLLLRLPLQQVSNISYVCEDLQHLVAIKHGEVHLRSNAGLDAEEELLCGMVVLLCADKATAERLCSGAERMFEEAYSLHKQEALVQMADNSQYDYEEESTSNLSSSNFSFLSSSCSDLNSVTNDDNDNTISLQQQQQQQQSRESLVLSKNGGGADDDTITKEPITSSLSSNEKELIDEYMRKLYRVLNKEQLQQFASLVEAWHTTLPFQDFLQQLFILYGPHHQYLLSEMQPFIPAKDLTDYEEFLRKLKN